MQTLSRWLLLLGLLSGEGSLAGAECLQPSLPEVATLREWALNTALVRSAKSTYPVGLGLVVGWSPWEIWLAVPAHVVFGDDKVPSLRDYETGLSVILYDHHEPSPLCTPALTQPAGENGDVVLVCLRQTGQLPRFNDYLLGLPQVGDEVRLLGEPSHPGRPAPGPTGIIESIDPGNLATTGADVLASALGGRGAQSGAVAYSHRGVIGLYVGRTAASGGRILSMAAIQQLADRTERPWNLGKHESFDCRLSRSLCPEPAEDSVPTDLLFTNVFTDEQLMLTGGDCADVPEGRYSVRPALDALTCEPTLIRVFSAAEPLRLAIRCALDLSGRPWRSSAGELSCMPRGSDSFNCFGLGDLGHGWLTAVAKVRGSRVGLSGEFTRMNGAKSRAEGALTLTDDGLLEGQIEPGPGLATIDLRLERED